MLFSFQFLLLMFMNSKCWDSKMFLWFNNFLSDLFLIMTLIRNYAFLILFSSELKNLWVLAIIILSYLWSWKRQILSESWWSDFLHDQQWSCFWSWNFSSIVSFFRFVCKSYHASIQFSDLLATELNFWFRYVNRTENVNVEMIRIKEMQFVWVVSLDVKNLLMMTEITVCLFLLKQKW